MSKGLKELLKPPFSSCKDGIVIDKDGWALFKVGCPPILENAKFSDWIAAAMNEKAERDLAEPLRWIVKESQEGYAWGFCPKCGYKTDTHTNFCPHCGRELDPPEGRDGEAGRP